MRIVVTARDLRFEIHQVLSMSAALERLGCETLAVWPHPDFVGMQLIADGFRPDAVIEIDRFRATAEGLPRSIKHCCYLQNHETHGQYIKANAMGSEILFALSDPAKTRVPVNKGTELIRLPWGYDPQQFFVTDAPRSLDFSFIGHLYGPHDPAILGATIACAGTPIGTMADLFDRFEKTHFRHSNFDYDGIVSMVHSWFTDIEPDFLFKELPGEFLRYFTDVLPRTLERRQILDTLLKITQNVEFFGTGGWENHPEYAPYFRGEILTGTALAAQYRKSKTTLQNGGVALHIRVLEAMACGTPIIVIKAEKGHDPYQTSALFQDGVHYVESSLEDLEMVTRDLLADEPRRQKMSLAAAAEVRENHSWDKRMAIALNAINNL